VVSVLVLAACVSLPAVGGAGVEGVGAWEDGVHVYANPFAGGTIEGTAGWGTDAGRLLSNIISWRSNRQVYGRLQKPNAPVEEWTWMTAKAGSPFQAGTVITVQEVAAPFNTTMPFTLALGNSNGGVVDWSGVDVVHEGLGTQGYVGFSASALDAVGTYDSFRLAVKSARYSSSATTYADMNEVIVLPDRLAPLAATASASSTGWGNVSDLVAPSMGTESGWSTTASTVRLAFDLGGEQSVDAIVFWSFPNHPIEIELLYVDDAGAEAKVAVITLVTDDGGTGWTLPIQFDKPIETGTLLMDMTALSGSGVGLRHMMFLTKLPEVPEPATISLLVLGGLAMLRRARK